MASITFQSVSTANGTLTKTYTLSETDHARWVSAMKTVFNQQTSAAALAAWADSVIDQTKSVVQVTERTQPNTPIVAT